MSDKKVKKVKTAKVHRYFILGNPKAESFHDSFTGITVLPNYIGVLQVGMPATSAMLERAVANNHIKEISADEVDKFKKDGYKEYGDHLGGHAENMEFGIETADDKKMEKAISKGLENAGKKKTKVKAEEEDEEAEVEDEEELDEDTEEDSEDEGDEDTEDEGDEDEDYESMHLNDLKETVKNSTTIPEEKKKGYSSLSKDKLIKLIKKHNK